MISTRHKFIFIHIPKTGGNSIQNILVNYSEDTLRNHENGETFENIQRNYLNDFEVESNSEQISGKHKRFIKYQNNWNSSFGEFSDFFKFSVVRNPWDRCISLYFYSKTKNVFDKDKFISLVLSNKPSALPQYNYLVNNEGEVNLDYIIKFESLQECFNIACDNIGIPKAKLPHVNKSKHKHYTEYYDDETRKIVAEKFAKDIEYFGYKFGE